MTRRYVDLCKEYKCKAKVYPKMSNSMKKLGSPDILVLFTNTISHKMVYKALGDTSSKTKVIRSHNASMAALKNILEEHAG